MFWMAIRPPKPPRGLAQAALMIEALGAADVAHCTSIAASTSSPLMPEPDGYPNPVLGEVQLVPGSGPGFSSARFPAGNRSNPNVWRKTAQSLVALHGPTLFVELQFQRFVSSTTTMFI